MNTNDKDRVSDSDNADQPDVAGQRKDGLPTAIDKNNARKQNAVIDDGVIALNREELVTAREDAAHLREEKATSREQKIHETEATKAASEEHMDVLQQVNARLVIATIEAQKMAELLQTTKDQMEIAKSMAEKANLAKSEFLSNMSHELRTPLNAILGFAQLLDSGSPPPTPRQKTSIDQILHAGWYLLDLINEILDLAKVESGKLSLSLGSISLSGVLSDCQAMIEPQAENSHILITFPRLDYPYLVKADQTRVKQVILNLLSNAIKYNRMGGSIDVRCSTNTAGRIRISIHDTGEGLSSEQLTQLFQPFNRLGQEAGAEEGTGIGLVVCKRLVELMGGTIGVESTVGKGSEFWFELHLDATPQYAVDDVLLTEPTPQDQENAALRTLLYVEDNPANLLLVEQIIKERPDFNMLRAHDAKLGIALARTHQPDIILMDVNLPGISGNQALKILREDPATAHIPVIAISANAMPSDIEKGLKSGFFRYLTKPIKINELMNALDDALKPSKIQSSNADETGQI